MYSTEFKIDDITFRRLRPRKTEIGHMWDQLYVLLVVLVAIQTLSWLWELNVMPIVALFVAFGLYMAVERHYRKRSARTYLIYPKAND